MTRRFFTTCLAVIAALTLGLATPGLGPCELRKAVDELAPATGPHARTLILSRESKLKQAAVLALAKLAPARQREVIDSWRLLGKLPRGWRPEGGPPTITVPRDPSGFVKKLADRLAPGELAKVAELLPALMTGGQSASRLQPLEEVLSWVI